MPGWRRLAIWTRECEGRRYTPGLLMLNAVTRSCADVPSPACVTQLEGLASDHSTINSHSMSCFRRRLAITRVGCSLAAAASRCTGAAPSTRRCREQRAHLFVDAHLFVEHSAPIPVQMQANSFDARARGPLVASAARQGKFLAGGETREITRDQSLRVGKVVYLSLLLTAWPFCMPSFVLTAEL